MSRPVIYVLAGVNGAGKSSIGGHMLTQSGLVWFNPDAFARALVQEHGFEQEQANGMAWNEGYLRLEAALKNGRSHAFETTLGGETIVRRLIEASATHDILVWYCSLQSPEQHIARVGLRVSQGGHLIAEDRIRERWVTSMQNLIVLMPHLAALRVYDNSQDVAVGEAIPEPLLVLHMREGRRQFPSDISEAQSTPDWAKPVLEAAFTFGLPPD